ncbi:MAG: aminopeptidase, partial [Anaerovoracaceae bacterium]|nr:aminopeptidase [Anaerovoracaceae bacterium]
MERDNIWASYDEGRLEELEKINGLYRECLDQGKTERECVTLTIRMAEEKGYRDLRQLIKDGTEVKAGDKIYAVCMDKSIALFNIGSRPLEEGMNILGAHIDSPRIDVKQNPLYESDELAYLDTHYYGGIKKYQWVTLPLAIHGVVAMKDGSRVEVCVGEKEDEPVFAVTDLLIHLAAKQMEKKAGIVIEGEKLDLLVGSRPAGKKDGVTDKEKDAVKKNILDLLKDRYGMTEEDFVSAELEIVP